MERAVRRTERALPSGFELDILKRRRIRIGRDQANPQFCDRGLEAHKKPNSQIGMKYGSRPQRNQNLQEGRSGERMGAKANSPEKAPFRTFHRF